MEHSVLIKRCQVGDKEAFQELISKYHPFIYKFLIRLTKDEESAEDLTQETFIKIIRNIDKFDINGKAKFSTYLVTVSKNCYIDYLRKTQKYVMTNPLEESFQAEDHKFNLEKNVIDKMDSLDVLEVMKQLPDNQRIVIEMKYIEDLTLKEIGDALNLETKTVKSRIHNGITKLRSMLRKGDE